MFGFFRKGDDKKSSKKPSVPVQEYEPPTMITHNNSNNVTNIEHESNNNGSNDMFSGAEIKTLNYPNTRTYSTTSSGSTHSSGFAFINDDDSTNDDSSSSQPSSFHSTINTSTSTTSSTNRTPTPSFIEEEPKPTNFGPIKKNIQSKGRAKPKNSISQNVLKSKEIDLQQDEKELNEIQQKFDGSSVSNNKQTTRSTTPIRSSTPTLNTVKNNLNIGTSQQSSPSHSVTVVEEKKNNNEENLDNEDISFVDVKVKPRSRNATSVNTPVVIEEQNEKVKSSGFSFLNDEEEQQEEEIKPKEEIKEKPKVEEVKQEVIKRELKEEKFEEEEKVDQEWIKTKSNVETTVTKYNQKLLQLIEEEYQSIQQMNENEILQIQTQIQDLESKIEHLTQIEEYEESAILEDEKNKLKKRMDDIQQEQTKDKNIINLITKTLNEMKRESSLIFSRVDFSTSTCEREYNELLKKNKNRKEYCKERIESENKRLQRLDENLQIDEIEVQRRKTRLQEQIESSTKDIRIEREELNHRNTVIQLEIEELERKLAEKKREQLQVNNRIKEISEKISKSEEEFKDQINLLENDEKQFQKRKVIYAEERLNYQKLVDELTKDLNRIETIESKKHSTLSEKKNCKSFLQEEQGLLLQWIDILNQIDKIDINSDSPILMGYKSKYNNRIEIIQEISSISLQLTNIKANLTSITLEVENAVNQLSRMNEKLPKLNAEKLDAVKEKKFRVANHYKEEIEKLTKSIQELELSIPKSKSEQDHLENERNNLDKQLIKLQEELEIFDKFEAKQVIRKSLKQLYLLKKKKDSIFIPNFDNLVVVNIIEKLIDLMNYRVNELKQKISISNEEFEQLQVHEEEEDVNSNKKNNVEQVLSSPSNGFSFIQQHKEEELKKSTDEDEEINGYQSMMLDDEATVDEENKKNAEEEEEENNETPIQKLERLKKKLEYLTNEQNRINSEMQKAVEIEDYDACETLDTELNKINSEMELVTKVVSELEQQIPPTTTTPSTPTPTIVEEEKSSSPEIQNENIEIINTSSVEPPKEETTGIVNEEDNNETIEQNGEDYNEVKEEENNEDSLNEKPTSPFDFINEDVETVQEENQITTDEVVDESANKSPFGFLNDDNDYNGVDESVESRFDFMNEEENTTRNEESL
ncbi:hypothetical protein ABK040_004373 [Willaertia magna]